MRKAYARATRNLTYVPRFHGHTVHYPITTVMGKTKLIMIPRSSGTGVTASRMMSAICKLAGIHNVMIKIQVSIVTAMLVATCFDVVYWRLAGPSGAGNSASAGALVLDSAATC